MQIKKTDNISFGTTIRLVSRDCFDSIARQLDNDEVENITEWGIVPRYADDLTNQYKRHWLGYRVNIDNCYTKGIRSCVGGVVANKNSAKNANASLVMHIENTPNNIENLSYIKPYFNGTNAIIIGSKNHIQFSNLLFSKIKKFAIEKMPTTILADLIKGWEASFAYISDFDVLYLATNQIYNKGEYAKSMEDLKKVFGLFSLSFMDKIEIIPKCKEYIFKNLNVNHAEKMLKIL